MEEMRAEELQKDRTWEGKIQNGRLEDFPEVDASRKDWIFAVIYLLIGYGFIRTFNSVEFAKSDWVYHSLCSGGVWLSLE